MKVPQRHCVPLSFCPEGPNGLGQIVRILDADRMRIMQGNGSHREHIQNCLPQLMPGFFVVRLMQGSLWLSQRGGGFLENNLTQDSLEASGSLRNSVVPGQGADEQPDGFVVSIVPPGALAGLISLGRLSLGVKKPLRDCCPLEEAEDEALDGAAALVLLFFAFLGDSVLETRRFSGDFNEDVALVRELVVIGRVSEASVGFVFPESSFREDDGTVKGLTGILALENMSLMLRRLSNSGRSLPESSKAF